MIPTTPIKRPRTAAAVYKPATAALDEELPRGGTVGVTGAVVLAALLVVGAFGTMLGIASVLVEE